MTFYSSTNSNYLLLVDGVSVDAEILSNVNGTVVMQLKNLVQGD